jgi:hypothetical protein
MAVIALAGVSAGAGTLALHAVSRHHPRAGLRPPAKAPSPDRIPVGEQHLLAPPRAQRSPTVPAPLLPRVTRPSARPDTPLAGSAGRVSARGTRASTPPRGGPALHSAQATNGHESEVSARPQPTPVQSSTGATQSWAGNSSNVRGYEHAAGQSEANREAAKEPPGDRGRLGSGSRGAEHGVHGTNAGPQAPVAAASTTAAEGSDSAPPGNAYGREPSESAPPGNAYGREPTYGQESSRSTPPGHEMGAGTGGSVAPGNSASVPGHNR